MVQITETIDVNVPVRTVYQQWSQFEDFPRFFDFVEVIHQLNDRMRWKVRIGDEEREFDAQITDQRRDERIAWASIDGENHSGVVTFQRLSDLSTRVTVEIDWEPDELKGEERAPLGLDHRAIQTDLEEFKQFIESRETEGG